MSRVSLNLPGARRVAEIRVAKLQRSWISITSTQLQIIKRARPTQERPALCDKLPLGFGGSPRHLNAVYPLSRWCSVCTTHRSHSNCIRSSVGIPWNQRSSIAIYRNGSPELTTFKIQNTLMKFIPQRFHTISTSMGRTLLVNLIPKNTSKYHQLRKLPAQAR